MSTVTEPKKAIYTVLKTINGATVAQVRPEIIKTFPLITFSVLSNVPVYTLQNDIAIQDIEINVDVWGKTSKDTGALLPTIETKMRSLNYRLTGNTDIVDEEGYSHLVLRFTY
jgi:hypothetical protein